MPRSRLSHLTWPDPDSTHAWILDLINASHPTPPAPKNLLYFREGLGEGKASFVVFVRYFGVSRRKNIFDICLIGLDYV